MFASLFACLSMEQIPCQRAFHLLQGRFPNRSATRWGGSPAVSSESSEKGSI